MEQEQNIKEENILGTEKIGKLIRKFSIPCIISLLVNSLYNIVDQIFIGWGVGYLGNGATNVVFPLTMVCLAFSLMFGDGSSAYLSLKLGEKKKEEAGKRCSKRNSIIYNSSTYIMCNNTSIFTSVNKYFWLYRCITRLCIGLWIYNSYRFTIYDGRDNIKFNNKVRWKSKICYDINDIRCYTKCYIRSNIHICI